MTESKLNLEIGFLGEFSLKENIEDSTLEGIGFSSKDKEVFHLGNVELVKKFDISGDKYYIEPFIANQYESFNEFGWDPRLYTVKHLLEYFGDKLRILSEIKKG